MTVKKKKTIENNCCDTVVGIMGWITGCIEGVLLELCIICTNKDDGNIVEEIDIFIKEMEVGFMTGKEDTKLVGELV